MNAHHAVAIVAVILVGFGLKLIFFSAPIAEAEVTASIRSVRIEISELHQNSGTLPLEKLPRYVIRVFRGRLK